MVPTISWRLIRQRAWSIPEKAGAWGRFLSCVMAAAWSFSFWTGVSGKPDSGTEQIVAGFGVAFATSWMAAVALTPIAAHLLDWLPARLLGAALGLFTWSALLAVMLFHLRFAHLSTGTCVVGVLATLRADLGLAAHLAARRAELRE